MISEHMIKAHLKHEKLNIKIFDVIDSTNSEAKRMALSHDSQDGFAPTLLIAKEQTSGRGRMGRRFVSHLGGIYMTLVYVTEKPLIDAVSITTAAAAMVAEAIESVSEAPMKIKWVNDIYNDYGKVAGILAETVSMEDRLAVIVGIGINTGIPEFPEEIQDIASSIGELDGKEGLLIAKITDGLLRYAETHKDRSYMNAYRERFMLAGKNVDLIKGGERTGGGSVVGVDDNGGLLLLPDGQAEVMTVQSGEVSVRESKTK
ncbi:MAG: biotin--[acetyl-CoA-carboxylase] ligase [Ruminococcaceae bacterium]|nr:biotin--[acetyl-CoA-carboxylase] ligase [Oscillospiraceae bacterium]